MAKTDMGTLHRKLRRPTGREYQLYEQISAKHCLIYTSAVAERRKVRNFAEIRLRPGEAQLDHMHATRVKIKMGMTGFDSA